MKKKISLLCATALACLPASGAQAQEAAMPLMATWHGTPQADSMEAIGVLPDGTLVVGGEMDAPPVPEGSKKQKKSKAPKPVGKGVLLFVQPGAAKPLREMPLDAPVSDLVVGAQGVVYATGGFGTMAVEGSSGRVLWKSETGANGARISLGPNGGVVVLANKTVTLLDERGVTGGSFAIKDQHVEDVLFDPASGRIFTTGYNNKNGKFRGKNWPIQVVSLRAFDAKGTELWSSYNFSGQAVLDQVLEADTRGYRLAMGGDGKLYLAGESAGGATLWYRSSQDVSQKIEFKKGDQFQNWFNTGANHITAIVRVDPKTGVTENGTLILARLKRDSGPPRGNTIRPRALAVDAAGRIYVGGQSSTTPPVSPGSFSAEYEGGGAFFIVLDADFKRLYASKFASGGSVNALAQTAGIIALAGSGKDHLPPVSAFQDKPAGDTDGWIVTLPALK